MYMAYALTVAYLPKFSPAKYFLCTVLLYVATTTVYCRKGLHIYVSVCICMCVHVCVLVYMCVYLCTCVCACAHACVHMYTFMCVQ